VAVRSLGTEEGVAKVVDGKVLDIKGVEGRLDGIMDITGSKFERFTIGVLQLVPTVEKACKVIFFADVCLCVLLYAPVFCLIVFLFMYLCSCL
jgi:hypothetical protein